MRNQLAQLIQSNSPDDYCYCLETVLTEWLHFPEGEAADLIFAYKFSMGADWEEADSHTFVHLYGLYHFSRTAPSNQLACLKTAIEELS